MTQGFTTIPIKHTLLDANLHQDTLRGVPNAGDMVYASGAGTWQPIGIGTSGLVLTVLSGRPAWQPTGPHNLLSITHSDTTVGSPNAGDIIAASGTSWSDYAAGATGNFFRVLGTTVGWQSLVQTDLPTHWVDGPQHTVSGQAANRFFITTGTTTFAFQAIPFSAGANMLTPVSGTNIMTWRAPFTATVTNVRGFQDVGTGSVFTARRRVGTGASPSVLYHLPSGATTKTAGNWQDGGPVLNTAYNVGDSLEVIVGSGAGSPTQFGIQVDFTRP